MLQDRAHRGRARAHDGLIRGRATVRRRDEPVRREEASADPRVLREIIEGRAAKVTALESIREGGLVHDGRPGRVDEEGAGRHESQSFGVDEVVTTLLLNFVILLVVNYLLFGPWKDPMAMVWPQAAPIID